MCLGPLTLFRRALLAPNTASDGSFVAHGPGFLVQNLLRVRALFQLLQGGDSRGQLAAEGHAGYKVLLVRVIVMGRYLAGLASIFDGLLVKDEEGLGTEAIRCLDFF